MNYRFNKRLNKKVSEVGFGAWQLGGQGTWGHMSKEEGLQLVKEAIKNGVTFFDTAPGYALGNSELILGEALQGVRDQVIINTKVGHSPEGAWEFTKEGIRHSVERSLKNLQTTYLDSVILHNPDRYLLESSNELFDELNKLREEGKLKLIGVSIDTLEELEVILNSGVDIDTIEIMFNMIHQEPRYLLDECNERGIFLITKVPLDSGWLTGKYNQDSTFTDIRSRWSKEDKELRSNIVSKIKDIVGEDNLVQKAIQYILHFDGVTVVIPGTKNIEQLLSNIKASEDRLSKTMITKLNNLYEKELKNKTIPW